MESRAKAFGHAIHPMLIVLPLGLLSASLVFDIIFLITGNGLWAEIAFWNIAAGVIGGLIAAPFGFIDWLALPADTRAKAVGLWHGLGNAVVLVIFAISWFIRLGNQADPGVFPIVLSFVGIALALLTAWLGGELVERLRVGVDDGAHLNAPNSLSNRPATESVGSPGGREWGPGGKAKT